MDSLPSFVDLMASLGLEQAKQAPTEDNFSLPQPSSPRSSVESKNAPTRSSSSPSLREAATFRYSPYLVRHHGI